MRTVIIIPARFHSSRFPGKPLANILGKPLVEWVAELSSIAVGKENVYVATDDQRIESFVKSINVNCIMTSYDHLTGTDRVAEASNYVEADIYVNVQGDEPLVNPNDIKKIINEVKQKSLMIAQTPHTFSGIEVALLDLLAKKENCPIYSLLGDKKTTPKIAYASVLFGKTPEETFNIGKSIKEKKFKAIKFGWQNFGLDIQLDEQHLIAAREGIGKDLDLMIDVGAIWGTNIDKAQKRLDIFNNANITWLEEPFYSKNFDITMRCAISGSAMALENNIDKIYGFQFHPESFLTIDGNLLIKKILSA